ncbi:putative receptor-like protein kinase [Quercus suber]|uniref:Receptor-like protein kinase n=1 Tax=Quercus suber TaxID=58331 RepID=A0AAW0M190_QUESU
MYGYFNLSTGPPDFGDELYKEASFVSSEALLLLCGSGDADELDFIKSLVNCSRLKILLLMDNQFKGMLPNVLGNLSTQLEYFNIRNNLFFGEIPSGLGNLISMLLLVMDGNKFTGTIPSDIGNLQKNDGTLARPSLSCNWSGTFFLALGFNATCLAMRKSTLIQFYQSGVSIERIDRLGDIENEGKF